MSLLRPSRLPLLEALTTFVNHRLIAVRQTQLLDLSIMPRQLASNNLRPPARILYRPGRRFV